MRRPLTVAAAQPACTPGDVAANVLAHADLVRRAGAALIAFPELSLTGYVLGAPLLDPADPVLAPLVAACSAAGAQALVGAPVVGPGPGTAWIATLAVTGDGASVVYAKTWLGGDEPDRFTAGAGVVAHDVDGWRVALGICRDTGVAAHVDAAAELDPDLYVAGVVHHADELAEQDRRGVAITRRLGVPVVVAGAAGAVGGGYGRAAGTSTIWSAAGTVLARAGSAPGLLVRVALD